MPNSRRQKPLRVVCKKTGEEFDWLQTLTKQARKTAVIHPIDAADRKAKIQTRLRTKLLALPAPLENR